MCVVIHMRTPNIQCRRYQRESGKEGGQLNTCRGINNALAQLTSKLIMLQENLCSSCMISAAGSNVASDIAGSVFCGKAYLMVDITSNVLHGSSPCSM